MADIKESDSNTFKILKDYFRAQLIKYFDMIPHTKNLIIDQTLINVIQHLYTQPPESCRVTGFCGLIGSRVSLRVHILFTRSLVITNCRCKSCCVYCEA